MHHEAEGFVTYNSWEWVGRGGQTSVQCSVCNGTPINRTFFVYAQCLRFPNPNVLII